MHQSWSAWAECFLRARWQQGVEQALENLSLARWHPNGFIVFRLGDVTYQPDDTTYSGSHRIHIWPAEITRRSVPGHPRIHSHDWELMSLSLTGEYRDVIYTEESNNAPLLFTHDVKYGGTHGDSITPSGHRIRLARTQFRTVNRGTCHHMDIGIPHETLVSDLQLVVTYVMMGARQRHGMMLAAEEPFTMTNFHRQFLNDSEQSYAERTLINLLNDQSVA